MNKMFQIALATVVLSAPCAAETTSEASAIKDNQKADGESAGKLGFGWGWGPSSGKGWGCPDCGFKNTPRLTGLEQDVPGDAVTVTLPDGEILIVE